MGKTLLLVDDSATMRKIVKKTLQQAGLNFENCLEAGNGKEGLAVLMANAVDCILSDVNMPEMDGLAFVQAVKADDKTKAIPVFMVTTEGSEEMVGKAVAAGAAGHIKKPFTAETMKNVLGPILG